MSNIVVVVPQTTKPLEGSLNNENNSNTIFDDQKLIEKLMGFWFGEGSTWSPKYLLKNGLWFGRRVGIDNAIKTDFEPLLLEIVGSKSEVNGMFQRWMMTPRGRIALLVLLDQFPRNIYRGTAQMFAFDEIALPIAMSIVSDSDGDHRDIYSPSERIFIYLCIQHCEKIEMVELALKLLTELDMSVTNPKQTKQFQKIAKSGQDHLDSIQTFKRYPHRNQLLGRESTREEIEYLRTNKKAFIQSVQLPQEGESTETGGANPPIAVVSENQVKIKLSKKKQRVIYPEAKETTPKLKILLLHSFRQNGAILKRATKKLTLYLSDIATITFANAPLSYDPKGETKDALMNVFGALPNTSHQRIWWNSNKDNSVYHHLDTSIHYLTQLSKNEGPFDGIIGFSQGAALTGILAILQKEQSLPFKFKFAVLISGFPSRADIHKPHLIPDSIDLPALSILGKADDLVDNDRTRSLASLFKNSKILEHEGGHFAPNQWPNQEIREFLLAQNLIEKIVFTNAIPLEEIKSNSQVEIPHFSDIMETSLKSYNAPHGQYQEPVPIKKRCLTLYGLSKEFRELISTSDDFKSILSYPPTLTRESIDHTSKPISKLLNQTNPTEKNIVDLLSLIWTTRINFKQHEIIETPLFYHLWLDLYLQKPESVLPNLESFPIFGTWKDICALVYVAGKMKDVDDSKLELLKNLRRASIEIFSKQLKKDYNVVFGSSSEQGTENADESVDQASFVPQWPSNCALEAPRLGGSNSYSSLFAKELARFMFPIPQLPSDLPNLDEIIKIKKGVNNEKYRKLVSSLSNMLRNISPVSNSVKTVERELFRSGGAGNLSEEQRQNILNSEPSSFVLKPEAEPVFPCPLEELDPLLEFMKKNSPLNPEGTPLQFTRGTILSDGRLDLCKNVVGPSGISPLLNAMKKHTQIKRLLLGNNIVGNGGAEAIAEYIKNNQDSTIDTWYIAGNDFSANGIQHITLALEGDTKVKALWLKRNPLLLEGAKHVSRLLEKNSFLQTLDLLNCGILDEGVRHVFNALQSNQTLKNLYVCTNGLTPKGASYISNHLASGKNHLESLYLSCNQLGDKGAIEIAKGLTSDKSLIRLGLASNCISAKGTAALVDSILVHPKIQFLDLGFVKATFTMGGMNNILGDEGAIEIARLIRSNKTGLRAIDLNHNGISQKGLRILEEALSVNTNITTLSLTQFKMVHNELSKEAISSIINTNRLLWAQKTLQSKDESSWKELGDKLAEEITTPAHANEILSVYRTK